MDGITFAFLAKHSEDEVLSALALEELEQGGSITTQQMLDARPLLSHSCDKSPMNTDDCLSLLECHLGQARLDDVKEEELGTHKESLPSFNSHDCDSNVHQNHSMSSSLSDKSEGPLGDLHDSIPRPSSAASSISTVSENLTYGLENVLAASQEEEQLEQGEQEKWKRQDELGKYLFFEERAKRRGRLLGKAPSLHEPGFSTHSSLLEISNALTEEEVKRIKFFAKGKINGFRLARITEAFELFEELETSAAFPCRYITNLLVAIQRHDLVEKLGIHIPLTAAKERSDHPFRQGSSCHAENASKLPSAPDYAVGLQHNVPQTTASVHVKDVEGDNKSLTKEGEEVGQSRNSSLEFSESSSENESDTAFSTANEESCSSSMKSALSTEEFSQFLASDVYFSNSNENLSLSSSFEQTAVMTYPSCTLQASSDSTDSLPSSTAIRNGGISSNGSYNTGTGEEQTLQEYQKFGNADSECDGSSIVRASLRSSTFEYNHRNTACGEGGLLDDTAEKPECEKIEEDKKSVDSCGGAIGRVQSHASALVRTDCPDSSTCEILRTKRSANGGNSTSTQQGAFSPAERGIRIPSSDGTDWERHGARPKQAQRLEVEGVLTEPVVCITDGLVGEFLARHTQDKALHDSIYQTDGMSVVSDIPQQRVSYINGDISLSGRAQPYFGGSQAASGTDPYRRFGNALVSGSDGHIGGSCHAEYFSENSGLVLNNRDFGHDSVESSDNLLLALERRVAEACALVERVLRERGEFEQFGREIERKEQLIREQRARERREREERELREAESWPQQQEAINARSQWLCEHYQRHCSVRFPCCTKFYPCHRCHNISKACENEEAKACHATHLKCSHCQHEQEIGEDSAKCRKCGGKMSAYFCPFCKHLTVEVNHPYHCEKCGMCRIQQDKSFHCEVCNVCLDKRLEGKHKCRSDSGHDECCICLEDAFSGCQILPCSHKVHRECAIAMIQNGIRTCPICRHPLYSQPRE